MPIIPRSWQENPRDDGKKATDWSSRKKAWNFYLILLITFLNTLASTVVAPGVPSIMEEFGIKNVFGGTSVISIFMLGQIAGPLLLAPISDAYGRLLVYHLSNLSLVVWNVACALAPNTSALLIFRLFAGCAAAGPLAIDRSSVEDMFLYDRMDQGPRFLIFTANRTLQRQLVLLSIASMLGPCIGPVFGGFLVEKAGWRWTFWLVASVVSRLFAFLLHSWLMNIEIGRSNYHHGYGCDVRDARIGYLLWKNEEAPSFTAIPPKSSLVHEDAFYPCL